MVKINILLFSEHGVDESRKSLEKVNSNVVKYLAISGQIAALLNQTAKNSKSNHWPIESHTIWIESRNVWIESSIRFESRFDFAHHCVPLNDSNADDAVCVVVTADVVVTAMS